MTVALKLIVTENTTPYLAPLPHVPQLKEMQDIVGGYIEPCFTIESPFRPNFLLTAYVNEEGLLIGLPIVFHVLYPNRAAVGMAGNVVFTAMEPEDGRTTAMTEQEVEFIKSEVGQKGPFWYINLHGI